MASLMSHPVPAQSVTPPLSDAPQVRGPATADEIELDISAQSLASALEIYSSATGRQVIYNGKLAIGRVSAAVKGVFTPEVALQTLLDGTGLSPRYMAADAFVLVPNAANAESHSPLPSVVVTRYYGLIQTSLRQAFCANNQTRPGDYRIAVSFWIGSSGAIFRTELLGTTNDPARDATIDRTLQGLLIGAPPPQGFAQPVVLVIAPGATRDCQFATPEPARAVP